MKRRQFLSFMSAAAAAPILPGAAAPAQSAAYSRYMYGLAVFHARTRAHISVRGLVSRLKVTPLEAQAMIAEMSGAGLVKPIGVAGTHMRAVSNILKPDTWGIAARKVAAKKSPTQAELPDDQSSQTTYAEPDLSALLKHLRQLCLAEGYSLRPAATPI